MTKIVKLSLVAAVAVAGFTTTSSANTLEEAFAASTVKGEIKSQYFMQENAAGQKASILTNGGNISVTTGSFNGLTAGVTFQTGHTMTDSADTGTTFDANQSASGSVMSEAYLAYTMDNTTLKIGRQYITTPLVAGSGSRMFKESFEGIVLVNTDVADTTLVAAYVSKKQDRAPVDGESPEFVDLVDGAYTVYAKNTSVENLAIEAQYAVVKRGNTTTNDDQTVGYINADYKLNPVTISVQTFQSDDGSATNSDGSLYGIKVAGKAGMVSLMAAYTTTDDETAVVPGLGKGADRGYTAAFMSGGGPSYTADTDSYKVSASTTVAGLGLGLAYFNWDNKNTDVKKSETDFSVSYALNKAATAKLVHAEYGADIDGSTTRLYLSYKF